MTQAQAVVWLNAQIGQHLDYDKQYGQQCFDFFNYYYQALTGHNPYADGYGVTGAKDIWDVPNLSFTKIADSSSLVPQPGDVLIYGASWGAGYGHVEVCLVTNPSGAYLVGENEHNNSTEGVVKVYRSWAQMAGLIGVMRPHYSPTQGGSMALTSTQDLDFLYHTMLGRARGTGEGENVYLNKDYKFVATDLYNSKEAQQRRSDDQAKLDSLVAQAAQIPAMQSQIDALTAQVADLTKKLEVAQAGNGDAGRWQTLRTLIKALIS